MKLLSVEIKNFSSFVDTTINLENKGVVSVEGYYNSSPDKSNGTGKSSLINSILWCNYGDAAKDESPDDVVNVNTSGGTSVTCNWFDEDTNVYYKISRYRGHKEYKNSLLVARSDDLSFEEATDISKGITKETQLLIDEILGANLETFKARNFMRQRDTVDIPAMTDKQLKELIEGTLNLGPIDAAYVKAKKERDRVAGIVSSLETTKSYAVLELDDLLAQGKTLKEKNDNFAAQAKEQEASLRAKLSEIDAQVSDIKEFDRTKLNELSKRVGDLGSEIAVLKNQKDNYKRYLAVYQKELQTAEMNTSCYACGTAIDGTTAIKIATDKIENHIKGFDLKATVLQIATLEGKKAQILSDISLEEIEERQVKEAMRFQWGLQASRSAVESDLKAVGYNPHQSLLEHAVGAFRTKKEQVDFLTKQIEENQAELGIMEMVVETLSPTGLRFDILETTTPYLNERTAHYLRILTNGEITAEWSTVQRLKSGALKEKFAIGVAKGKIKGYRPLSGGQQRRVKLACFFALQDLVAQKAIKPINLLCVDEIDYALDAEGLEGLTHALNEKIKSFETILIISHNDMKNWVMNKSIVSFDGKNSTVSGVLTN